MSRWGKCDFGDLKKLRDRLENAQKGNDMDAFLESCVKELAARLLALVIKETKPGEYKDKDVEFTTKEGKQVKFHAKAYKKGGTLRRGWTADTEEEAMSGGQKGAKQWANDAIVAKKGDIYEIEVVNPVHYAPYVEYGHRTPNGKGWVTGKFYLTRSQICLEQQLPRILDKMIKRFLEGVFNGK